MPVHDWSRSDEFHDVHTAWVPLIRTALNSGLLPDGYYALSETKTGVFVPDVMALRRTPRRRATTKPPKSAGGVAVAVKRPRTRIVAQAARPLVQQEHRVGVFQRGGDRVVAIIEIASPGNGSSVADFGAFINKALTALRDGVHLLVVDVVPPTSFAPHGFHAAIWDELSATPYAPPPGEPFAQASYLADRRVTAFVEPVALGRELPAMPLFLRPDLSVDIPLEATYRAALAGAPRHVLADIGAILPGENGHAGA